MSYLLFMDESGHDHRNAPYEVRGGVALSDRQIWPFVRAMRNLMMDAYGGLLSEYGTELKGHKLLDKDRFRWAEQMPELDDNERRRYTLSFLNKGTQKFSRKPTKVEFTAYGQASIRMARGTMDALLRHGGKVFAVAISRGIQKPDTYKATEYLRKDIVFLLERYFYFLEEKREMGLLVLDETDCAADRRFVRRLERYFSVTQTGHTRSAWVVPSPFFVSSDMALPVQAADLCIYCVNHGFRLPRQGMDAPVRDEIASEFGPRLLGLRFKGERYDPETGQVHETYGINFVGNPYGAGSTMKR